MNGEKKKKNYSCSREGREHQAEGLEEGAIIARGGKYRGSPSDPKRRGGTEFRERDRRSGEGGKDGEEERRGV